MFPGSRRKQQVSDIEIFMNSLANECAVRRARWRSTTVVIVCQVACMSVWFSASAAVPDLVKEGIIGVERASWLTGAVQLGFVCGTLVSAVLLLADRLDPRRLFAFCATFGAAMNALLLVVGFADFTTIVLRFLTGFAMAGVYPVGMKLAAGWADRNIGLMIGMLVGAVTLGSSLPHLFSVFDGLNWRLVIVGSSTLSLFGAGLILTVRLGPRHAVGASFAPLAAISLLKVRSIRLATLGYLGHMWELYAMWAWIGSFMAWAWTINAPAKPISWLTPSLATFLTMAAGAPACVVAGRLADRYGRTATTMGAMVLSGGCAVLIGPVATVSLPLMLLIALIWGASIVADSAQFSAAVVELTEPQLSGTTLTLQTCLGFLLTFFIIQFLPYVVEQVSWVYAFTFLALGPVAGVVFMWRLRSLPEASQLARGLR